LEREDLSLSCLKLRLNCIEQKRFHICTSLAIFVQPPVPAVVGNIRNITVNNLQLFHNTDLSIFHLPTPGSDRRPERTREYTNQHCFCMNQSSQKAESDPISSRYNPSPLRLALQFRMSCFWKNQLSLPSAHSGA
jgi:hypothetical protein